MNEQERMSQQEQIGWQQAAVDALRAAFLSHVARCADCRADLRCEGTGRLTCAEVGAIMREWERAQQFLAEMLLRTIR